MKSEIKGNRKLPNLLAFQSQERLSDRFAVLKDYYSGAKQVSIYQKLLDDSQEKVIHLQW